MNTFLPYNNFKRCAKILDNRRLNKQITECIQILNIVMRKNGLLNDGKKGWLNHPVLKIWTDNEDKFQINAFLSYADAMYEEWIRRGYSHIWPERKKMYNKLISKKKNLFGYSNKIRWNTVFHKVMKQNLLRKDSIHYIKFKHLEPAEGYIWINCKSCN